MQSHPRLIGHNRECWQNVFHWRKEWQATPVFLPQEPQEQYEKPKIYDTRRWAPQVRRCPICSWEELRNSSRKNEVVGPKEKWCSVVDVTGDGSKVWCCKEQYCIGTWNVRSMNQGKLEVVKQKMARVNIDILGISELKWTGMLLLSCFSRVWFHATP